MYCSQFVTAGMPSGAPRLTAYHGIQNATAHDNHHAADRVMAGAVDPEYCRASARPSAARTRAAGGILRKLPCDRENRQ